IGGHPAGRHAVDAYVWGQLVGQLADQSQPCVLGSGVERTAARWEERSVRQREDHAAAGLAQRLGSRSSTEYVTLDVDGEQLVEAAGGVFDRAAQQRAVEVPEAG